MKSVKVGPMQPSSILYRVFRGCLHGSYFSTYRFLLSSFHFSSVESRFNNNSTCQNIVSIDCKSSFSLPIKQQRHLFNLNLYSDWLAIFYQPVIGDCEAPPPKVENPHFPLTDGLHSFEGTLRNMIGRRISNWLRTDRLTDRHTLALVELRLRS